MKRSCRVFQWPIVYICSRVINRCLTLKLRKNMKKSLIFFLMLWSCFFAYAQHLSITGKVTDRQDEPIIGASVLVKVLPMASSPT